MTPFKKLAYKIAKHPNDTWFCCNDLKGMCAVLFFEKFFMPTIEEAKLYQVWLDSKLIDNGAWMRSKKGCNSYSDNQDRITALLFADQLWQDKQNRKYERK
jgi:hypothetical protein